MTFGNEAARFDKFAKFCFVSVIAGGFCVVATNGAIRALTTLFSQPIVAHTVAYVIGNPLASVLSFGLYRTLLFGKSRDQK